MHGVLRWTEVVIVCQLFLIVDLVENRCSSDPHGETSTNWTGVITSPNFGKGLYLNDEYCVQHVRVSFGSRVKVVFEFFDLESGRAGNSNDCWDYVQIADGQDSKVRQVVMHCGRKIPPALQSETNQLTITFSTDRSKVYRGFRIRYTGICDNDIIGPNALLQSPGYPSSPPIGISCQWRVKTFGSLRPAIHLESIGYAYTHCNQSGIKVLQTVNLQMLGYMCRAKADVFYPTEGNLIVMYHERETAPSTIFSINVTAVETNQCLSTPCASGATCVDHGNTYTCSCRKGFSGRWCDIQIDECTSSPCRNGGTCLDYFNRFECLCRPGLQGPRCEVDADECSSWPCLNGAKCIDGVNSYTCACASGFAGRHCEHDVDECLSRPCQNDGTCADERGEYRCLCPPGFSGRTCETVTDRCASHPCLNAATCRSTPAGGFTCACRDGFTGKRCESDVNECAASPCEAGATCVDRAPGFRCLCPPNRTGARCHDVIDHCHDGRCFNGGECISDELGFTCQCAPGFRGQTCERNVDECRSSPCSNGATCSNTLGGYSCECAAGYAGRLCQQETDECGSSPCSNGAVCRNRVAGYECVCREGFAGKNCEFEDSPCSSDPCLNGGRCVAYLRDFFCDCEPGHTGNTCATEIDDCAALPCRNNATCTDRPNGFLCACKSGYTGSTCAQEIDACTCHPCKNGGRCKNFQGSYNCQCSRGFSGVNCEGEVDECASGPCAHHGTCTDAVNAFDCECTEAYTGATCQDYIYKDEPHCVEEIDSFQGSGMYWPHTRAGYAKVLVCPPGVYGNATRECYHDATSSTNGTWGRPDLGGCVNPEFLKIAKTARKLLAKKHVAEIEILQITDSILTTINRNSNSSARLRLYPGDLAVSTDIAAIIADVVNRTGHFGRGLDDIAQGFGKIVGAVVHPLLVPVWKNANPNMVEQNMATLLTSTERLAENIFNQKPYQVSGSRLTSTGTLLMPEADFSVVAENVDFSVTTVSPKDNYTVLKSLQNGLQSSEISLPPEVLKTNRFHQTDSSLAVFSARFTSMGELLSLKSDRPDVSGNGSMINSDVMSCRVLGVPQGVFQQLSSPVVIVFKLQNSSFRNSLNDSCVFMNMSALSREDRWLWTGCRAVTRNDTHTVCHCFHLTNFALLMDVYGLASKLSKVNARALSYISYIGGTLSILGCLLSVCVFEYFRLRSDRIRIHEQLAVSIIFVQVVFLVGVDRKENLVACKAVAIILHYFIMAMFCWMFVEGVHLYVVLVKVFKTGSHLKKYLAMGWGIPLVVVGISVGVFFREYGKGNMCWMTTFMLQILFVPTVALVILLNTVVLIIVVRVMLRSLRSSHRANIEETSTIRVGLKATAVLLPLLGLTWTFGFLSIDAHNTLIFTYIFTALNCLQGLFFFIFHCLMNVDVRNAYKRRYRGRKRPATADRSYSAGHKTSADFESYGDFNGGKHIIRNSGTSVETNMTDMSSFERKRATLNEKHPNLLNRSTSNGIVRNGIKADRKATEKVEDVDSVKGRPAKDRKGKRVPRAENRMESESDKNDPGEVRNEEVTRYADETDSDDVTSGAHQTGDVGDNVAESDDVTSDVDGEVHKILSEMDSMLEEANKK